MSKLEKINYIPSQRTFSVKSNQGIDIFKKRMEEAFSSPDSLKFEIQNSSIRNTRSTLLQLALLLFLMILALSGFALYKSATAKVIFCSPGFTTDCKTCPDHSVCERGEFTCNKNYIKEGYECVEDQNIIQRAYSLIHKAEEFVIEKSIEQYLKDRTHFYATLQEIKYLFRDSESIDDKFVELMMAGKAQRLVSEYLNGEQIFRAKIPYLRVINIIQIFWDENFYYLILGFLVFAFTVFKLIQLKKQRLLKEKANHMYELIRNQLKSNVDDTPEHGVPEDTLKDAIISHLGQQTADVLWPVIEGLRKSDKQVSKFEIHLAGRPQILWQWKDIRNPKPK